ncbi:PREDICTED: uncharacterized protein LOC109147752 [Ipomoea nil]|uniref:uncharacterized protein LOC109147752 n=1 Tax=Ipomoea nil TaxID=35883 RepID=UPI0009015DA1|nr:PREDICTED: uncharacterized protein LOC109147752 [Ipomoea nil]
MATPVNLHLSDSWRWLGDIRGIYTVKHGYRLLTMINNQSPDIQSFRSWKSLWALPILPKVKNLLWRCARGILPLRENLKSRRVWISGGCPLCGFVAETAEHLFCGCQYAQGLWEENDISHGQCIHEFMDSILSSPNAEVAVQLAAIFWVVWETRNAVVWSNMVPSAEGMKSQVHALRLVWKGAYASERTRGTDGVAAQQWNPPPRGSLKCNIDAAVLPGGVGYGAVVRDHVGSFVAAKSGRLSCECDPLMAESMAAREALSWLKGLRHNTIILESDCLILCNAFNSNDLDFSYVGLLVKQCQSIASDIGSVKVQHVKRTANQVAHVLARATISLLSQVRGA